MNSVAFAERLTRERDEWPDGQGDAHTGSTTNAWRPSTNTRKTEHQPARRAERDWKDARNRRRASMGGWMDVHKDAGNDALTTAGRARADARSAGNPQEWAAIRGTAKQEGTEWAQCRGNYDGSA